MHALPNSPLALPITVTLLYAIYIRYALPITVEPTTYNIITLLYALPIKVEPSYIMPA